MFQIGSWLAQESTQPLHFSEIMKTPRVACVHFAYSANHWVFYLKLILSDDGRAKLRACCMLFSHGWSTRKISITKPARQQRSFMQGVQF